MKTAHETRDSGANASEPERRHALSFDVEEFFHVANLSHAFPKESWDDVPSRIDVAMDALLELLDRRGARATMFFLGWVAKRRPDLVKRCYDAGHEIASHGWEHEFLWDLDGPDGFREHLRHTEEAIEAAGAPRPVGFRASTFTLTRRTWWAFDVLAERGYLYDSSVHPVHHPTYGVPDFPPTITTVETEHGPIVEFPVTTLPVGKKNMPIGGGGYFRLLPGPVHRAAIARVTKLGRPVALYLHPWEFDPDQPRIPAPAFKKFRHYVGLEKSLARLDRLLERWPFGTMAEVLGLPAPRA
ncbi:MAG: XrtA system polysaccharide deacetylase [Planctomycetota bacterium]